MPSTPVMDALKAEHDRLAECRDDLRENLRKVEEKIRALKQAAAILSGEKGAIGASRVYRRATPEKLAAADAVLRSGGTQEEAATAADMSRPWVVGKIKKGKLYHPQYTQAELSKRISVGRRKQALAKATTP
jgi:hypothetical protein